METFLGSLPTEQINKKTMHIDMCSTVEMLEMINDEDSKVSLAVRKEIPHIAQAVDVITERIKRGGRLFYVGAGTSGRIGILDASECPPTFGTDPELVQGIIAGGSDAMYKAVEGAEDNEEMGVNVIREKKVTERDVIVGISASGRTPFVLGAVREAKSRGATTIGISNCDSSAISREADIAITVLVGPEVIMGSTRMKSGTSQKLVLNMITTSVMIKLGKVYGNLMVDLQPTNEKLIDRSARIIMHGTGVDYACALELLKRSGFNPKLAIVMAKTGLEKAEAEELLRKGGGFVTKALNLYK
jgi:N-acetylmuramic acid 6-phosphate etherase